MKKIVLIVVTLLFLVGCRSDLPSDVVKNYFSLYKNQNEKILAELDELIKNEELTEEQGKIYKEIMMKQYKDLNFDVTAETYNGDEAIITANIEVYDLYKSQKEAENYRNMHREEFKDYSDYLNYKLDKMKKNTYKTNYTIHFKVIRKEKEWILENIPTEDLEKIHGIYNYDQD